MTTNTGSARYEGPGKDGKGHVSAGSGALSDQPYGFPIPRSDLVTTARVPRIAEADFEVIAADAKANCPISKLLNAGITLMAALAD